MHRLSQQANSYTNTAAARCTDSLCLSGSQRGPSQSWLQSFFKLLMIYIGMYVWVPSYLYISIFIHIIHAQIHSFFFFHRFISMDKNASVLYWSNVCLHLHPFFIREGKEAEKGGYGCLVLLTSFCCRFSHCGNSHNLISGCRRPFKANSISHKDL